MSNVALAGPSRRRVRHDWALSPAQGIALQRELAARVSQRAFRGEVRVVAGLDVSHEGGSDLLFASAVALDAETAEVLGVASAQMVTRFPYVPGLLSFREAPVLLEALAALRPYPQLLFIDGHGRAHPRRMGIACHIGLWTGLPAIGAGKSLLCGRYEGLEQGRGAVADLVHRGEVVGRAVRTRDGVSPVFVSPGHRVSLDQAVTWVLRLGRERRVPEPTRVAHLEVNRLRRAAGAKNTKPRG